MKTENIVQAMLSLFFIFIVFLLSIGFFDDDDKAKKCIEKKKVTSTFPQAIGDITIQMPYEGEVCVRWES